MYRLLLLIKRKWIIFFNSETDLWKFVAPPVLEVAWESVPKAPYWQHQPIAFAPWTSPSLKYDGLQGFFSCVRHGFFLTYTGHIRSIYGNIRAYTGYFSAYTEHIRSIFCIYGAYTGYFLHIRSIYGAYTGCFWSIYGAYTGHIRGYTCIYGVCSW